MVMKMQSLNSIQQTMGDPSFTESISHASEKPVTEGGINIPLFLCILLGGNDQQIEMLLGLFNDVVGYRYKGLVPTDYVM